MYLHAYFRQKIEDLEAERQRLEEQNNTLEMRLERHNLQVGTKIFSLSVFHNGFTHQAQKNQFNNPNGSSLAQVTSHSLKTLSISYIFQAKLGPVVISTLPKTEELEADLK